MAPEHVNRSARRIPVLLQTSAVECGAACLAMILGFYGRITEVSECTDRLGTGRDGTVASRVVNVARGLGLEARGLAVAISHFGRVSLPAIAHWEHNHYVIIERWAPDAVEVVDPARGRRRLSMPEFEAGFTGVALTFSPGTDFEPRPRAQRPGWRRLGAYVLQMPGVLGLLLQVLGASALLQVIGLIVPLVTRAVVDRVLPYRLASLLPVLGLWIGVLLLTLLVTASLRALLLVQVQGRIDSRAMQGLLEHLLGLPYRFFQARASGDLVDRMNSVASIRDALTSQTASSVLNGTFVVGYLLLLLAWTPIFGLLTLGLGVLQVLMLVASSRSIYDLQQRELAARGAWQGYLVECLEGVATLKVSGAERHALGAAENLFSHYLRCSLRRNHRIALLDSAQSAILILSPLVLLCVGAFQVLAGRMSLGTLLAASAIAGGCLAPLGALVAHGRQLLLARAYMERIASMLDARPEQSGREVRPAHRLGGHIELRGVSFRYDSQSPWVLRDVSAVIRPGQKVAIVGRTGSGKTTLAMLLLGIHEAEEGEILYDGQPLTSLDYRSLRGQCGVVLQEPFLFAGSIRQNITLGDPALTSDQVITAARRAGIHDEISRLPMGYDTLVAEGGSALSGGQRQRLALARALVREPSVLLLDEATSSLDSVTERIVDASLDALRVTRVVIAHRLSTIRNADVILVLADGQLVEQGPHERLMTLGGHYTALVGTVPEVPRHARG